MTKPGPETKTDKKTRARTGASAHPPERLHSAAGPTRAKKSTGKRAGGTPDDGSEADAAPEAIESRVGAYLRLLRSERGLSLAELAVRCGVSRAMLSQIEQGHSSPTIAVGWKIANGLGVPFGALLGEPTEGDFVIQRAAQAREVFSADKALRSRALFPLGDRRVPELYELILRPGGVEEAQAHALGTRELLYIEEGTLALSCAGQRAELHDGDALFFRADQAHRYENPGTKTMRCILVMSYPERSSIDAPEGTGKLEAGDGGADRARSRPRSK